MPTYADLWNEQQRVLGQLGPSNPVRLTISKGEYVHDPQTGRFRYDEHWEEEHLMEDEECANGHHLTASPAHDGGGNSRESSPLSMAALQPIALQGCPLISAQQPSLWVLDTNTLMSCLELLKALFASLLTRNVAFAAATKQQYASSSALPTTPSSIKLVLPYIVVSELDGLKVTSRKDDSGRPVASKAREANHWLLSALQKQKRVSINELSANLSQDLWPLFVQPSTHYNHSKRSRRHGSHSDLLEPDDEIIQFCVELKKQTASHVRFCSDDINARTKAETDGVDSLGMRELANALKHSFKDVQSSEKRWILVADALIEQWEYQIAPAGPSTQQDPQLDQGIEDGSDQTALQPFDQQSFKMKQGYELDLHSSVHKTASFTNNETMEVDMETEAQQQQPKIDPFPVPLTSPNFCPSPNRIPLSTQGRSTNDSIHNPSNLRTTASASSARFSRDLTPAAQATPQTPISPPGESEALNPQVDWQDLIQQYRNASRTASKQRNGKW